MPSAAHDPDVTRAIGYAYIAAIAAWTLIIIVLVIVDPSPVHAAIGVAFGLPLLFMWFNHKKLIAADEHEMLRTGILSIGIVITVTLMNRLIADYQGSQGPMAFLVLFGLGTLLLSVLDFYFGPRWMGLTRHIRIILQTFAVGATALAAGLYCIHRRAVGFCVVPNADVKR
jgi:hypothetical protein